jgi:hypothetical protein
MKRVGLILAILGFVLIGSLAIPHTARADCSDWAVHCSLDHDWSKTVATTTFSMCWSWKHFGCRPCHGGGEWSYLASWCNNAYAGCKNECSGCFNEGGCCFDAQGNSYGDCSDWDTPNPRKSVR